MNNENLAQTIMQQGCQCESLRKEHDRYKVVLEKIMTFGTAQDHRVGVDLKYAEVTFCGCVELAKEALSKLGGEGK